MGQFAAWLGLWCFWTAVSRHHHPTLLLDGIATALMLAAYAVAVYANWLVLLPRYWQRHRFLAYWAGLLVVMGTLTALVVLAIQAVYDVLWGPDPLRYGFWMNFGLDFAGMCLHLLAAAAVVWFVRRRRGIAA